MNHPEQIQQLVFTDFKNIQVDINIGIKKFKLLDF